ncbi:hybrid sensor histidine kinase/response regulator transcription factor [Lunatibacter salilacus]|uniref:hybrid sensor histidine kinase/response regulator transcription factor n=1 Tax=Lunatibacter salilacus TaxID=2483804 RepID=UPI00131EB906|nr:two-component regulator propeller domain-containing protein [Lunatibacter salilacus]
MHNLNLTVFFLLLTCFGSQAQTLENEYVFKSLNENHGLSNSNVQSIHKDALGYMWFATANGLNRFDGTRIRGFFSSESDSNAVSSNSIVKIFEGPENNLWLKNSHNNFDVFLLKEERFTTDINRFATNYSLLSTNIKSVTRDREGRYWFTHPSEGISIYDPEMDDTQYISHKGFGAEILASNEIACLAFSPIGYVWILYTDGTIEILNSDTKQVVNSFSLKQYFSDSRNQELELFLDSDGDAWVFDLNNDMGIFYVNHSSFDIKWISTKNKEFTINNNLVKSISEYKAGEIWLGTDHGGINILDKKRKSVTYLMPKAGYNSSLSSNAIYAMFKDPDGIVWIGTHKSGVNFYHEGLIRFSHVKNSNDPSSLPYNDVNVFAEDSLGNLFIGTNGDGLIYHDRSNNTYTQYKSDPNNPNSLSGNVIVAMEIDQDGELWLGTYLHGLSRFDGTSFTNYRQGSEMDQGISDASVWKIFVDSQNRIWIGTLRGGLNLFDKKTDQITHYLIGDDGVPINNEYITAFEEDEKGNLWVGGGYGIDVINLSSGYFRYYSGLDPETGLVGNNISEILRDSQGVIWVTTSEGLNYFDVQNEKFVGYTKKDGLPSDYVVSVLEDEEANLWVSTHSGLSYINIDRKATPFTLRYRNFNISEGLQAPLFNKNSALKTASGELIFGGPNGYNIFKTANFGFALNDPKVILTGLSIFNKPVHAGETVGGRVIITDHITQSNSIQLKHDENIFSLEFSALNFLNFEKVKFRYKLKGFNEEWTVLDQPPFRVTYTNLDPGTYELVLQTASNDGGWSDEDRTLEIRVLAPFWKTPGAYFLYFLLGVGMVFFARRQLLTKEREKFRRLEERRETQRIKELDELKTRFFTNVSHEFKTPLTLILAPVEKLLRKNTDESDRKQFLTIQKNGKRLLQLINQILDVKNIEKGSIDFNPSKGDIVLFVANKVNDFKELSEKKNISLNFKTSIEALQTSFDADKLEKIIYNMLSNAIKFTPMNGTIALFVELEEINEYSGRFYIHCQDTGIGISQIDLPRVFDRYFTSSHTDDSHDQGTGIGLSLALEFAKIQGGNITVTSKEGEGSHFTLYITVPIKKADENNVVDGDVLEKTMAKGEVVYKPTLLLVDDNLEFSEYLKEFLEQDYNILFAHNGKIGLEKALENIPDLIISDLMMPVMDGVALCQAVKSNLKTSHIPVIILTARSSEEKQLEGLHSGCNLYISKPFKLEILASSIENLIVERNRLQKHYKKIISVNTSEVEIMSMDDKLIQDAMKVVEKNMDNPEFSVEQLSKELFMSRVHLYKKLSALTGKSPIEFIRLVRLQRAAQLLEKSQLSISEVAYQVGYNNAKYFTKHFKAEFGVLPSQYLLKIDIG